MLRNIFCCDSRGNNFDKYEQPDIKIEYIIVRGATVSSLQRETLHYLHKYTDHEEKLNIKVCVGINDLLRKVNGVTTVSDIGVESLFHKLKQFKSVVQSERPNALFGFVTIPHCSLADYGEFCAQKKNKTKSNPPANVSQNDLVATQSVLNQKVNDINRMLITENFSATKIGIRPLTVQFHKEILHLHTKRAGKKKKNKTVHSYHFSRLYDGLHAKSHIKRKWFRSLVQIFKRESNALLPTPNCDYISESEDNFSDVISDTDSEPTYTCWKRQKYQ
ncbi:MAG: hypothetical protein ABW185_05255 [Sedimenticola sp.]